MKEVHPHFSRIAHRYKDLRTTDAEPVLFVEKKLQNFNNIEAADVGCGTGRYAIKLFHHLGERLHLRCIDYNRRMLKELTKNLGKRRIKNFTTINAAAGALPLASNSLDAVFTFNAIHHFKFLDFLEETSRILRENGYSFIYTRLRSQNKRNIWGRFFPGFHEKEKRLYEMNELKELVGKIPHLRIKFIEYFKYKRIATLEWLTTQATHHHYSTFYLYNRGEFEEALQKFQGNITHHFKSPNNVNWDDENIMLTVRKNSG